MVDYALSFLDYPYVAGSLEGNEEEQLVVDLTGFDCTTLVETCLALSIDSANFEQELQRIRYRDGIIDGYTSRLHYMTDWVADNEARGIVRDMTCEIGGEPFAPDLYYMSKNHRLYPHLKDNKENVEKITAVETHINQRTDYCYIPTDKIDLIADSIRDGDMLFFTTSIPGLDVQHAGIAYHRKNGQLGFIHASSKAKKVIIEPLSLSDYCRKQKTITGIMVVRR